MKRSILASVAAAACVCMPLSSQAAGPMPSMFDWSGPFAGANLGYGFGHDFFSERSVHAKSKSATLDGAIVGGEAGYNKMMGSNLVLGIAGDFAFSGINSVSPSSGTYGCDGGCKLEVNWFGTARGRLGYAMGNTMPYVTAGLAAAGLDASFVNSKSPTAGKKAKVGWTVGAGIEHAFSSSLTGKIEYLYADLGRLNIADGCVVNCFTDVKFSVVRAGLDFHF